MTEATSRGIARRTLAKGAAWSVPAVAMVAATPAMAASGSVTFTNLNTACKLPGASCRTETGVRDGYTVALELCSTVTGNPGDITVTLPSTLDGLKDGEPITFGLEPSLLVIGEGECDIVFIFLEDQQSSANVPLSGSAEFSWEAENGLSGTGTLTFSAASTPPCDAKIEPDDNNNCAPTVPTTP